MVTIRKSTEKQMARVKMVKVNYEEDRGHAESSGHSSTHYHRDVTSATNAVMPW